MSPSRISWLALAFSLVVSGGVNHLAAQDCLPPLFTVETFKERLVELAETDRVSAVRGLVRTAMAPRSCPLLPEDEDLDRVLDELIRWMAVQDVHPLLPHYFFAGVSSSVRQVPGRPHREFPLEALTFAVEEGRAVRTRGYALSLLERRADDPGVMEYLLRWVRAEVGPPTDPNLPLRLATSVYFMSVMPNPDAFREALESDPTQVRNPRVRCWVEHGRIPQEIPGQARICPE